MNWLSNRRKAGERSGPEPDRRIFPAAPTANRRTAHPARRTRPPCGPRPLRPARSPGPLTQPRSPRSRHRRHRRPLGPRPSPGRRLPRQGHYHYLNRAARPGTTSFRNRLAPPPPRPLSRPRAEPALPPTPPHSQRLCPAQSAPARAPAPSAGHSHLDCCRGRLRPVPCHSPAFPVQLERLRLFPPLGGKKETRSACPRLALSQGQKLGRVGLPALFRGAHQEAEVAAEHMDSGPSSILVLVHKAIPETAHLTCSCVSSLPATQFLTIPLTFNHFPRSQMKLSLRAFLVG